jgi:hypothetical protein
MEVSCSYCNKIFNTWPSRAKQQRVFCSRECYKLSPPRLKVRKVSKICKHCKKGFMIYNSKAKRKCGVYCSKKCYSDHIKPQLIKCFICSKSCQDFRGKRKRKYCSINCSIKKKFPRGEKNPHYKNGIGYYKTISKNTTNKICSLCQTNKNIEMHHIDGDRTNNTLTNLTTICRCCHMRIHKIPKRLNIKLKDAFNYYKKHLLYNLSTKKYNKYWTNLYSE